MEFSNASSSCKLPATDKNYHQLCKKPSSKLKYLINFESKALIKQDYNHYKFILLIDQITDIGNGMNV